MELLEDDKASYYFKLIPEIDRLAVDYDKLEKSPFPICVVISERKFRVKTYGAKKFCYKKWKESGSEYPNTIWFRNLVDDIEVEEERFLTDIPDEMKDVKLKSKKGGTFFVEGNAKWLQVAPINSTRSLRGSRQYFKYVVWDEFNDSTQYIRGDVISNFLNLLSSTGKISKKFEFNDRKAFILGNNRTINHPLFFDLGISSLEKEVTKIYAPNGLPLMLIICPILSEDEIEKMKEELKNDWEFQFAVMTGKADHIYFNAAQYDKVNSVYEYWGLSDKRMLSAKLSGKLTSVIPNLNKQMTLRTNTTYLSIFNVPKNLRRPEFKHANRFHVASTNLLINSAKKWDSELGEFINEKVLHCFDENGNEAIFVSDARWQEEGELVMDPQVIKSIRDMVSKNWISFENVVSRDAFFNFLNKK